MRTSRSVLVSGSTFAVAFLGYVLIFDRNFDTQAEAADWLDNGKALLYVGAVAIMIAGVAFLWFITQLRTIVATAEPDDDSLVPLMYASGVLFVGMLWVATPIDIGIAEFVGSDIDYTTYKAISNIGHQHVLYSQIAIGVMLAVIFVVGRRSKTWPSWIVWLTGTVAITSVAQLLLPALVLLLPIWTVLFAIATRDASRQLRPTNA